MEFRQLLDYYKSLGIDTQNIAILYNQDAILFTLSPFRFAYLLSSSHADSMEMVGTERIDTITQLRKYATNIFGNESGDKFNQEFNGFLTLSTLLDTKTKKNCELAPIDYRLIYGCIIFPTLAEFAIRVYNTPVLITASERHGTASISYIQKHVTASERKNSKTCVHLY